MDIERCYELLAEVAIEQGAGPIEPLNEAETTAVLDLARVAAHTVERKAAPLLCFAVGRALAALDADGRMAALTDAIARIEAEASASADDD